MARVSGLRWAVAVATTAWLLFGATAAQAQTHEGSDAWWGQDKALHFSFSAGISAGSYALSIPLWDEPLPRTVFAASLGLSAGVAKELYDLAGYGDPSWRDLTWDVIGVTLGTGLMVLLDLWLRDDPDDNEAASPGATPHQNARDATLLVVTWR